MRNLLAVAMLVALVVLLPPSGFAGEIVVEYELTIPGYERVAGAHQIIVEDDGKRETVTRTAYSIVTKGGPDDGKRERVPAEVSSKPSPLGNRSRTVFDVDAQVVERVPPQTEVQSVTVPYPSELTPGSLTTAGAIDATPVAFEPPEAALEFAESTWLPFYESAESAAQGVEVSEEALQEVIDALLSMTSAAIVGDPVNASTGALVHAETDFLLKVGRISLPIARYHTTGSDVRGSLGPGWFFSLDTRLIFGTSPGSADAHIATTEAIARMTDETTGPLVAIAAAITSGVRDREATLLRMDEARLEITELRSALASVRYSGPGRAEVNRAIASMLAQIAVVEAAINSLEARTRSEMAELGSSIQSEAEFELRQAVGRLEALAERLEHTSQLSAVNETRNRRYASVQLERIAEAVGTDWVIWVDAEGITRRFEHRDRAQAVDSGETLFLEPDGSYAIARGDHTIWRYGSAGEFLSVEDANGSRIVADYADERIVGLQDSHGRQFTLERDPDGTVVAVRGPESWSVEFGYEAGMLARVTDAAGDMHAYRYEDERIAAIAHPDGSERVYEYERDGLAWRVSAVTDEERATERFSYPEPGVTMHTSAGGVIRTYHHDGQHRLVRVELPGGAFERWEYSEDGREIVHRDPDGFVMRSTLDSRGRVVERQHPDGPRETWSYAADPVAGRITIPADSPAQIATYTARDGTVTRFSHDSRGNLTGVLHPDGTTEQMTWEPPGSTAPGALHTHTDRRGNLTRFRYDSRGRVERITDHEGTVGAFSHDALGRRSSVADGVGNQFHFAYRADGLLESVSGPDEYEISYEYSPRKDLLAMVRNGARTEFTYDSRHLLRSQRLPDGSTRQFRYEPGGQPERSWLTAPAADAPEETPLMPATYAMDDHGRIAGVTYEAEGVAEWGELSAGGRLAGEGDAAGWAVRWSIDHLGRPVSREQWTGTEWAREEWHYDHRGRLAGWTDQAEERWLQSYDPVRRELVVRGPDGHRHEAIRTDPYGLLTHREDGEGNVTSYDRDRRGRIRSVSYNGAIRMRYEYDDADRVTAVHDGRGARWTYAYDALGNLVTVTNPDRTSVRMTYDRDGNRLSLTDETGRTTRFEYDENGRLQELTESGGGRTTFRYHANGIVAAVTDATGRTTSTLLDEAGRMIAVIAPDGARTSYRLDAGGRLLEVRDATGRTTGARYNARGLTTELYQGETRVWQNQYDRAGRLERTEDGIGVSRSFTYDRYGRLSGETSGPFARTITYDRAGRPRTVAESDGRRASYSYRSDGMGSRVDYSHPSRPSSFVSFTHDAAGNLLRAETEATRISYRYSERGFLEETDDGFLRTNLTYDAAGRVESRSVTGMGEYSHTGYEYDEAGRLSRLTVDGPGQFSFDRDPAGRETRLTYPGGMSTNRTYGPNGDITSVVTHDRRNVVISGEAFLLDRAGRRAHMVDHRGGITSYGYDAAGRLTQVVAPDAPQSTPASTAATPVLLAGPAPDLSLRVRDLAAAAALIHPLRKGSIDLAQARRSTTFAYDAAGNRISRTTWQEELFMNHDASGRLVASGATAYDYDVQGNLTRISSDSHSVALAYDARGLLSEAAHDEQRTRYLHDAFGRRFAALTLPRKDANGLQKPTSERATGELFHRSGFATLPDARTSVDLAGPGMESGLGRSAQDAGPRYQAPSRAFISHAAIRNAARALDLSVGERTLASISAAGPVLLAHDSLASVRVSVAPDGGHLEHRYDAFGSTLCSLCPHATHPYRFAGKLEDSATSLLDYGFRSYLPEAGRFTTPDPIRHGLNWYAFPGSDPVNQMDPHGLSPVSDEAAALAQPGTLTELAVAYFTRTNRLTEKANLQQQIRELPMYQPGGGGNFNLPADWKTWCNQACFDYAAATSPALFYAATGGTNRTNLIGPTDPSYGTNANQAFANLSRAATINEVLERNPRLHLTHIESGYPTTVTEVSGRRAQSMGNLGYTVIAARPNPNGRGHMGVVSGNRAAYDPVAGAQLSNVGQEYGAIVSSREAFGRLSGVRYFVATDQDLGHFDSVQSGNQSAF